RETNIRGQHAGLLLIPLALVNRCTHVAEGPIKLAVKLPFPSESEFLGRYGGNVSKGGIYLRTRPLHPPGTAITLDVKLESGQVVLHATCEVKWVTGAQPGVGAPGMGLQFLIVDAPTQRLLDTMAAV